MARQTGASAKKVLEQLLAKPDGADLRRATKDLLARRQTVALRSFARSAPSADSRYSCAGSGSIVSGFTGTCTSSRYGDVISVTRMRGKASMNAM